MRRCAICGAEFQEKNAQQKYCSDRCRIEVHRRRVAAYQRAKKGDKPTSFRIVCKNCGKVFTGTSKRLVYCSPACRIEASKNRSKAYWEKRKESLMREQICAMCGKTFRSTLGSRTRFCPECRIKPKKKVRVTKPKPDPDRLNSKIKEAQEKHISYGMLQVLAAREAAKEARERSISEMMDDVADGKMDIKTLIRKIEKA